MPSFTVSVTILHYIFAFIDTKFNWYPSMFLFFSFSLVLSLQSATQLLLLFFFSSLFFKKQHWFQVGVRATVHPLFRGICSFHQKRHNRFTFMACVPKTIRLFPFHCHHYDKMNEDENCAAYGYVYKWFVNCIKTQNYGIMSATKYNAINIYTFEIILGCNSKSNLKHISSMIETLKTGKYAYFFLWFCRL